MKAQRRAGFTLIELLVVVVIIGILASIGVSGFATAQDRARNSNMMSNVRTVLLGVENWKTDNSGLPTDLLNPGGTPDANYAKTYLASGQMPVPSTFPKYVPGGLLPKAPWSNTPQLAMDPAFNGPSLVTNPNFTSLFVPDSGGNFGQPNITKEGHLSDAGDGAGSPPTPGQGPSTRRHYGYVYYIGDASSGRYMVCGVGKYNKEARVVAVKSNFQ